MSHSLSSKKSPAFEQALTLLKQAGRTEQRRYLVEGVDLVEQALGQSQSQVHTLFVTQQGHEELAQAIQGKTLVTYIVPPAMITDLTGNSYATPCQAVAVADQLRTSVKGLADSKGIILCGEAIQDPRNVGVMIRIADALGCEALLLDSASVDPWSRQSVRSTTGSILRTQVAMTANLADTLGKLRERGVTICATTGNTDVSLHEVDLSQRPLAIVMGNEQNGISQAVMDVANTLVRIPMSPTTGADSLNVTVAAGITIAEARRQADVR
jgi:TrmH family RNA methyltransferase